jgi:hypothetical protein
MHINREAYVRGGFVESITEEELFMVHDYITLSVVSDDMDHEISKVDAAGFKFPSIIKGLYRQRQDEVFKDIFTLRVVLSGRGIKIYEKNEIHDGVQYKFEYRTIEHTINCLYDGLKTHSSMKLCELLDVDPARCGVFL